MDHLIIEGFIGSGKGAVAKTVAKELGLQRIDVDQKVAEKLKMTSGEIYDRFGESYYRAMETVVLDELKDLTGRYVIILGSGVAMMPQNAAYLKELGRVYYIKLNQSELLEKMRDDKRHAWIQGDKWEDQVVRLYKEREPAYRRTADVVIDAEGKSIDDIAAEIIGDAFRTDE